MDFKKTLMKKISDKNKCKEILYSLLEELILLKCLYYQNNIQIQGNTYKNSNDNFHRNRKKQF